MKRVIQNGFETNMFTKNFVFLNFVFFFILFFLSVFLKTDCFKRKQQEYEHAVEIFVY